MLNSIGAFLAADINLFLFMVVLPAACGALLWLFRKKYILQSVAALLSVVLNLVFALGIYTYGEFFTRIPFAPFGFEYLFRVYGFSAFFVVFAAAVFLLIVLYAVAYLKNANYGGRYLLYMFLSFAMVNGAMLSDNLGMMLLFWEGLLATLFGMLLVGNTANPKTAFKALAVSGLAVLLLMLGIIVTTHMAGTSNISEMEKLPQTGIFLLGFITMMSGALGKGGVIPFHSWTLNAAEDAPAVFMVALPGALEKILGIYLAARIVLDIYTFEPGGSMSIAMMTLGVLTIVAASAMALIQEDIKRLLAYLAISQFGLMVLGIGTGLPSGIIGGVFHLVNYAVFQTGLFMISGYIEKRTGTTDLRQLGGLRRKMPVATACFVICALSSVGFPGFGGFFSSGLVSGAALDSHPIFYIGTLLGTFLTALSFLKMGRSVFFGRLKLAPDFKEANEKKAGMLVPISILSVLCVLFGFGNSLLLDGLLGPALGMAASFSGWPYSAVLTVVSVVTLLLAICDHRYGTKKTGNARHAADHIQFAPGLKRIFSSAEKGRFDPYNWLMAAIGGFSDVCVRIEHGVGWIYDSAVPGLVKSVGTVLHRFDNGSLPRYLSLTVFGMLLIAVIFLVIYL